MSQHHSGDKLPEPDHMKVWAATLVTFGAVVAMWAFMLPDSFKDSSLESATKPPAFGSIREVVAEQTADFEKSLEETERRLSETEALQMDGLRKEAAQTGAAELREKIEAAAAESAAITEAPAVNAPVVAEPKLP